MFNRSYSVNKVLFDENLLAGQDSDFYIRLLCNEEATVKILDFYGTFYRIHQGSISERIYRNGSNKMLFTHYESLVNQVQILRKNNKLDRTLKRHYALEISKRLPAVVKTNNSKRIYFYGLLNLSGFNLHSLSIWIKVMMSFFSFTFFGKGERFLK